MADMSKQSDAQLRALMAKDSGADAKTVRAAYSELEKRGQKPAFAVTLVLGGRPLEHPKAPPPRPKRKGKKTEMAYGGMAGGKKHMYAAGGMVKDNPGLKALKASGPKGMEAYKKITGK